MDDLRVETLVNEARRKHPYGYARFQYEYTCRHADRRLHHPKDIVLVVLEDCIAVIANKEDGTEHSTRLMAGTSVWQGDDVRVVRLDPWTPPWASR